MVPLGDKIQSQVDSWSHPVWPFLCSCYQVYSQSQSLHYFSETGLLYSFQMYTLTMRKLFLAQLLGRKHCTKHWCIAGHPALMPIKSFLKAVYQFSAHIQSRSSELRYPMWPGVITGCQLKPTWWGWTASRTGTCKGPIHLTSHWSKYMFSRIFRMK